MNRRSLLRGVSQFSLAALFAKSTFGRDKNEGRSLDSDANFKHGPDCEDSCAWFNKKLAVRIMDETGDWKETVRDRANGKNPIVVTRAGGHCCEVTLQEGAHHPNWSYKTRLLTKEEHRRFLEEYGQAASLLLGMNVSESMQIRGFIFNGRVEGWNISTDWLEKLNGKNEVEQARSAGTSQTTSCASPSG